MKNEKNIDELIKKALTEYVDADTKEETAEVTYSKEHEEKMKKIFDDVTKDTKIKKANREIVIRIKFDLIIKVAIILIIITAASFALTSGIKAWKENNKLEMFGENEEYSWLLSENTSELYEQKTSQEDEEYVKAIFEGISGEIQNIDIYEASKLKKIRFEYNNLETNLKMRNDVKYTINSENINFDKLEVEGRSVYYWKENEKNAYRWKYENLIFDLYSELTQEEAITIIKSINYEKIETNF